MSATAEYLYTFISSRDGQGAIAMARDVEHGLALANRPQLPAVQAVTGLEQVHGGQCMGAGRQRGHEPDGAARLDTLQGERRLRRLGF